MGINGRQAEAGCGMEELGIIMTSRVGTAHERLDVDAEGSEKAAGTDATRIAIISDTHNLLRPEVAELVKTCGCVLHGGDISDLRTLDILKKLAPVYAVKGNNDKGDWADRLPGSRRITVRGVRFFLVHNQKELPEGLSKRNTDVIIFGHSHKYVCEEKGGILWLNPGSCGKRRFGLPITMAVLLIGGDGNFQVQAKSIESR